MLAEVLLFLFVWMQLAVIAACLFSLLAGRRAPQSALEADAEPEREALQLEQGHELARSLRKRGAQTETAATSGTY